MFPLFSRPSRRVACAVLLAAPLPLWAADEATEMLTRYRSQVTSQLIVPALEVARFAQLVELELQRAAKPLLSPQYLMVVDRNPDTQAGFLFWWSPAGGFNLVGASSVSTGQSGNLGHFETPLGVFEHSTVNPDFRSEGIASADGIQVYGAKGLRVFNFGWQQVSKGWGDGTVSQIRLQMHATDPDLMERRLGSAQSTGGVHIPASLIRLLDHHGVLDADYDQALREGRTLDVLQGDREQVRYPGRYLVVVDSGRTGRPDWSPAPFLPHRRPTTPAPG